MRGVALAVVFGSCTLALALAPAAARAQGFFSSSPGPLTTSHASLDSAQRCNDCHVNGTRAVSNELCLGCHDHQDLGARIKQGKGFHASGLVRGKPCEVCHQEHKGRGFDLMGWSSIKGGQKGFDHDLTLWPLKGKHASTDCGECHEARNKQGLVIYMGTDTLCGAAGCHGNAQPHKLDRKELLRCERRPAALCEQHPQQLAVAPVRRVPHAVVVHAGAVRSQPGRLQPDRPAPDDRVLRLPPERQLRGADGGVRRVPHRRRGRDARGRPARPLRGDRLPQRQLVEEPARRAAAGVDLPVSARRARRSPEPVG